jgi:hypothetical protein
VKKREILMLSSTVFSLGVILGFLLSPVKKGILIYGGDSTNNNYPKNHSTTDENNNKQQ